MTVIEKIKKIIFDNIDNKVKIEDNTNLRNDLEVDSFDVLMIMNGIEDEFAISLEENDLKEINTPLEIQKMLKDKYGVI
jgi:acyl carrier protein